MPFVDPDEQDKSEEPTESGGSAEPETVEHSSDSTDDKPEEAAGEKAASGDEEGTPSKEPEPVEGKPVEEKTVEDK